MKVIVLVVELKAIILGLTVTLIPSGASIIALYMESWGPTFVTFLVIVVDFLRFGMVIEGRFTSKIAALVLGQIVGCSAELL